MGEYWEEVTPESVGISSESVQNFIDDLEREELCLHGFLLIRKGKIFSEGYYAPFSSETPHRMYSISKSLTSLAIGLLREEGALRLEDRICTYFPDKWPDGGVHPFLEQTTIGDMLRMATPHGGSTTRVMKDDDWVKTFFHVEPVKAPGTSFAYDTTSTHVLAALVERLSGVSLLDFLKERFLSRIGVSEDVCWLTCPMGICHGGSGLICTLRDTARIARVIMDGGVFRGERILPEAYLREATSRQIDTCLRTSIEERQGYGYQFWLSRYGGYVMYGLGGQLALCLPRYNFIMVTGADTQGQENGVYGIYRALWDNILPDLKADPQGEPIREGEASRDLKRRTSNLQLRPLPGGAYGTGKREIGDSTYHMEKNHLDIRSCRLSLDWEEATGRFHFEDGTGNHVLAFGFGIHHGQKFPGTPWDCISSARWEDENKLYIRTYVLGDDFGSLNITITLTGESVSLAMKCYGEGLGNRYDGYADGRRRLHDR